ncbi:glycosyltransferase [Aestuariibaculum sp. M13]|uniref:glycosyltransferase n=1 Tax=Aestuariibaculum sp. M13 TaxID=2967132 RepID=UPI002159F182|nr:glycosyltransferase [Aestuariibaculum sp. M13]MCR8666364.1 glycosyltransferase [Aestuariibaculum sp. M13]
MMKTICFVVPSFPVVSETFVLNQILEAKAHGFKIRILANKKLPLANSSQRELLERNHIMEVVSVLDYKIPENKLIHRLKALYLTILNFKSWKQVKGVTLRKRLALLPFQIAFFKKFRDVDVFHAQFAHVGIRIAEMKKIGVLKGKLITTFHGYDAHFENDIELKVRKMRYEQLLSISDCVTVNTMYLGHKVIALGCNKNKLHVIPMGVNIDFFKYDARNSIGSVKCIKLLSAGRLVKLKGFDFAIRVVKVLLDKGYNVEYSIVGEGVEKENLAALVKTLGLETKITLLGKQTQEDLKHLYATHDIFIMSSVTDDTGRAEAQGVVTAEAQAMGLPVVAFNSGGVPYTMKDGETGYLVAEKDITSMAKAIIKIITFEDIYTKMSASAIAFVHSEFSSTLMLQRFLTLYNN